MTYEDTLKEMWFQIGSHAITCRSIAQTANLHHDVLGLNQDPLGQGRIYNSKDTEWIVEIFRDAILNGALATDALPYLQKYDPRGDTLIGML